MDITKFNVIKDGSALDKLTEMTSAWQFERDVLKKCVKKRLSKVTMMIDYGEYFLENNHNPIISLVPFIIMELANCDVRKVLRFSAKVDIVWKLQSLHNVVTGLKQLEGIGIAHQDLKPSNVLIYSDSISKVGDLNRSACTEFISPYDDLHCTGERDFAPPELLYNGYDEFNWENKGFSSDAYMFGNLIVFYFSGVTMNSLIKDNLDKDFWWDKVVRNFQSSFTSFKEFFQ